MDTVKLNTQSPQIAESISKQTETANLAKQTQEKSSPRNAFLSKNKTSSDFWIEGFLTLFSSSCFKLGRFQKR